MNKNELMKNMSQAYLLLSEKRKEEFSYFKSIISG